MVASLTRRQSAILDFIRAYIATRCYPPTIREVCEHFDIRSPNGVMCHLRALQAKGVLVRDERIARGIRLTG